MAHPDPYLPPDRWERCCDDERELLLAAAHLALADHRAARNRARVRRTRRMLARVLGWPYPARRRRVARLLASRARSAEGPPYRPADHRLTCR